MWQEVTYMLSFSADLSPLLWCFSLLLYNILLSHLDSVPATPKVCFQLCAIQLLISFKTPKGTSGLFIVALWSFLGDFRVQSENEGSDSSVCRHSGYDLESKRKQERGWVIEEEGAERWQNKWKQKEREREASREAGLWGERGQRMRDDWRLLRGLESGRLRREKSQWESKASNAQEDYKPDTHLIYPP